jgi:hypothetical protein
VAPCNKKALLAGLAFWALLSGVAADLSAQGLPSDPITLGNGFFTLGSQVDVSAAPTDYKGWFNYTDYQHDALRLFRVAVSGAVRTGAHLEVLGDVRAEADITEGDWTVRPYALYLRVRPWVGRAFDIQAGEIPPSFGTFGRRGYGTDNPLVGMPLAYQYLTALRADAVPSSADDLLRMRAHGWSVRYPIGNTAAAPGLPVVNALRYDTGVQVHVGSGLAEISVSLTNGTLAKPLFGDDNDGKQLSGRLALNPTVGLILGVSGARGAYLARAVTDVLPPSLRDNDYAQQALGADVEYSRGHWLLRAELIVSEWRVPTVNSPYIADPVRAVGTYVEWRWRIRPRIFLAGRVDHLGFSEITGSAGPLSWDAPVTRIETGGGYHLQRNLVLQAVYQYNWRDGGAARVLGTGSVQLRYWF